MTKKNTQKIDESLIYQLSTDIREKNRLANIVFYGSFFSGLLYFILSSGKTSGLIVFFLFLMLNAFLLRASSNLWYSTFLMIFFSAPIVSLVILGTWWTVFLAFLILFIDIDFTEMLGDKANEFTNMVGKALPLIQIFLMEAFWVGGMIPSFIIFYFFFYAFFSKN